MFVCSTRVCFLLGSLFLFACTQSDAPPSVSAQIAASSATSVTVTDFLGRKVRLNKPAQRIVALAPHIVENLYSIGAGEKIVGVVDHSDYPPTAKDLPSVGSFNAFGLENLLALKPDLIILWGSGNGLNALKSLEALQIPVYVDEMESLADISKSLRNLGALTGRQPEAEAAAAGFSDAIAALKEKHGAKPSVSVFYQVWNTPLQTINGAHIISEIIQLCGGRNIFADEPVLAPKINQEAVVARNPDVIIASGVSNNPPPWLNDWAAWPQLNAVKNKQLFFIPPDIIQRHTLRIQQGAELLCQKLKSGV